ALFHGTISLLLMRRLLLSLILAGCGAEVPPQPTWFDDVQPILTANCVRCHGADPRNDAPSTFRLDVYADTLVSGRRIRGARFMALFAMLRATHDQMPPVGPKLSERQKEILRRFAAEMPMPIEGMPPPDLAPSIQVDLRATADEMAQLPYEITAPLG